MTSTETTEPATADTSATVRRSSAASAVSGVRTGMGVWFAATALVVGFGVLAPALLLLNRQPFAPWAAINPCLVVTFWASLRLGRLLVGSRHAIFQIAFWSFVLVFLGLSPVASMSSGAWALRPAPPDAYLVPAGLLILVSLAAVEVGGVVASRRSAPQVVEVDVCPRRASTFAVAAFVPTLLLYLSFGLSALFSSRAELGSQLIARYGDVFYQVVAALARFPILVAAVCLLRLARVGQRASPSCHLGTCVVVILAVMATSPITAPRFVAGTALLALWCAWTRPTLARQRFLIVMLPVALVVILPYADLFRTADVSVAVQGIGTQLGSNGDYDAFMEIVRGLAYVSDEGHTYGLHLLGALLFFIPRFLWPDKPVSTSTDVAAHAGSEWLNVSSPLWLEMYVDLGLMGLLIAFVGLGALLVWCDRRVDASFDGGGGTWWSVLGPLVAFYSIVLYRGSLQSMVAGAILITLSCICVRRRRESAAR